MKTTAINIKDAITKTLRTVCRETNLRVIFRGDGAKTDGRTIYLPSLPEEGEVSEDFLKALRGFGDHEGRGHVCTTNFSAQEGISRELFKIVNIVEDWRIERAVQAKGIGYAQNLQHTLTYMMGKHPVGDNPNIMQKLWVEGRRQVLGQTIDAPDFLAEVLGAFGSDIFDRVKAMPLTKAGTKDAVDLAKDIARHFEEARDEFQQKQEADAAQEAEAGEGEDSQQQDGDASESENNEDATNDTKGEGEEGESEESAAGADGEEAEGQDAEDGEDGDDAEGEGKGQDAAGSEGEGEESEAGADEDDAEGEGEGQEGEGQEGEDAGTEGEGGEAGAEGEADDANEDGDDAEGEGGEGQGAEGEDGGDEGDEGQGEGGSADERRTDGHNEGDDDEGDNDHGVGATNGDVNEDTFKDDLEDCDVEDAFEAFKRELEEMHKAAADAGEYMPYSDRKDVIAPLEVADHRRDYADRMFDELRGELGNLNTMRSRFANLFRTMTRAQWMGDRKQGRLNARALASVKTGNTRVFKEKAKAKAVNTACTFLVDYSGSMYSRVRNMPIRHAMKAVVLFLETLAQTKVDSEVIGFTTGADFEREMERQYGRHRVVKMANSFGRCEALVMREIKGFNESYSGAVKRRIGDYQSAPHKNNADAESVTIAYKRLKAQKADRRVLFVLSDGQPAAWGNRVMQDEELRRIAKVIDNDPDVEIIAIGFGPDADVDSYYPTTINIPDYSKLSEVLFAECQKLLKV